jgi:hypothetical protein
MSSVAGEWVDDLLGHKICGLRLEFIRSASSFFLLVVVLFPAARTPIRPAAAGAI